MGEMRFVLTHSRLMSLNISCNSVFWRRKASKSAKALVSRSEVLVSDDDMWVPSIGNAVNTSITSQMNRKAPRSRCHPTAFICLSIALITTPV